MENRKGYSCWSREDPGCGFVIWKRKAGKSLPVSVAKELMRVAARSKEAGEDPGVGRTEKQVTGFKGRSGRQFRAKLKLEQDEEGKWRVDFDEEWATSPRARPSDEEGAAATSDGAEAKPTNGSNEGKAEADAQPQAEPASSTS